MAELTEYIKKIKIKYIYFENASQALASTLAETGVRIRCLESMEESLTEGQTKDGADYISIIQAII